jgi:two-component system sensor histidine kinase KdpD
MKAHEEELRSTLLSTVSHDLRTPLGAITGAATSLRDDATNLSSEERRKLAEAICGEAERLDRLIGNLLDMTRLQFGGIQLKRQWVSLDDVIASALGRIDRLLDGRVVRTQLPEGVLLLSVDRALLEQVFVNLLENAAKYTPKELPVDIVGRKAGGAWEIDVADRGPGIDSSIREKIFDKFFRGPNEHTPGAGLGLAICRGIAQAHGGSLILEARPGGGSIFRVTLPSPSDSPALTDEPLGVPGMESRS